MSISSTSKSPALAVPLFEAHLLFQSRVRPVKNAPTVRGFEYLELYLNFIFEAHQRLDVFAFLLPSKFLDPQDTNTPTMDNASSISSLAEITSMASTPTFLPFRKLPIEIRLKIWKLAALPRVVEVRFSSNPLQGEHEFMADFPVQLHVCQESRTEALKTYKLSFDTNKASHPTYFDFDHDILYVRECRPKISRPHSEVSPYLRYEQLAFFLKRLPGKEKIQRLAISNVLSSSCMFGDRGKPLLLSFPNLKEVRLLLDVFMKMEWHYGGSGGAKLRGKRGYFPETNDEIGRPKFCTYILREVLFFLDMFALQPRGLEFHSPINASHWLNEFVTNTFPGWNRHGHQEHRKVVSKFLELQGKGHWGPVEWNKPAFVYTDWCSNYVSKEEWHLKAIPDKVHQTRARARGL